MSHLLRCCGCKTYKDADLFGVCRTSTRGRQATCKECRRGYYRNNRHQLAHKFRRYYDRNREKIKERSSAWYKANPVASLASKLRRTYGLAFGEYMGKLEEQDGLCAICRKAESASLLGVVRSLGVDHDHETGAVRGLLCDRCNKGLGFFKENPHAMRRAADYIEHHTRMRLVS